MAASRAPVPAQVSMITSCVVPKYGFMPSLTRMSSALNSSPRWLTICRPPASRTDGGSAVGPGIRRLGSKRVTSRLLVPKGSGQSAPSTRGCPARYICRHMATARTTILLDVDLLDRLDRHVRRQRATKTSVVAAAVESWLDSHEATPEFPFLGVGRSQHGRLSV